jgi:hypothetical protein
VHPEVLFKPGSECLTCRNERDGTERRAKEATATKGKAAAKAVDKISMKN